MGAALSSGCCAEEATAEGKSEVFVPSVPVQSDGPKVGFDFFFSHKQSEAQDAAQSIIFHLKEARPGTSVWVDVEQNPTEQGMEDGVRNSKVLIFYCTENIPFSKYCLKELGWAVSLGKRIALVAETDPRHGAPEIGVLRDRMPEDLRHVFDNQVAIPYYRDPAHRQVCIQKLLDVLDGKVAMQTSHGPQDGKKPPEAIKVAAASSGFKTSAEAVKNAHQKLVRELKGNQPTLTICNLTCTYDCAKAQEALLNLGGAFLGCTSSAGVMVNQSWCSHNDTGFGLFGIYDPEGCYVIGHANSMEEVGNVCKDALERAGQVSLPDFTITFPHPGAEETFLLELEKALGGKVPVIGGSSADNSVAGEWKQLSSSHAKVTSSGYAFALCWPSVLVHAGFCSGFSPTENSGKITKMHNSRHIATIDGQKAAIVYNKWSAGKFDTEMKGKGDANILGPSTLTPLAIQYGTDPEGEPMYVVAHPHLLKPGDMSVTTFKDLPEGAELTCLAGTKQNLVTRLSKVSAQLLKQAPFKMEDIVGSFQIFCGGVMMAVKDDMPIAVEKLGLALDWKPSMGAVTFGEQGTFMDGTPGHGNLMFSSLVFSRIKKESTIRRTLVAAMQMKT
eukprot:TRINITY_DN31391_c0_g1_i2.p1 TRINITY_DN31391_c0_g1~~TRINITY_DN31391_c0_g1_i2.p1  ORF type:complete len:615 (+),score=114.68 TRINITY_DN31391_c0_g1_i2:37-1881(+)